MRIPLRSVELERAAQGSKRSDADAILTDHPAVTPAAPNRIIMGRVKSHEDDIVVESTVEGERATVVVRGELDVSTRKPLFDALVALVAKGINIITVDLSGVPFMDSSGLSALFEARRMGVTLTLRNPSPPVRRILDLVVIEGLIAIEDV